MVGPLREIGKVFVGQVDMPFAHIFLCQFDEIAADGVANSTAAGMQHHPHALLLVKAQLDEVVARAQRAEMHEVVGAFELAILRLDPVKPVDERRPCFDRF